MRIRSCRKSLGVKGVHHGSVRVRKSLGAHGPQTSGAAKAEAHNHVERLRNHAQRAAATIVA